MKTLSLLAISCIVGLAACQPSGDNSPAGEAVAESLYFEPIGAGQAGRLSDTTEVVIRTPERWDAMRDSLRSPEPFRPVDFSQTMVMVAALPQTSGGYRIQFESIEKTGEEIVASYVVYAPGTDCLTIMALTLPFQAVAVRKAEGDVRFRRRVEMESCAVE